MYTEFSVIALDVVPLYRINDAASITKPPKPSIPVHHSSQSSVVLSLLADDIVDT
jgi:hypothetical protein